MKPAINLGIYGFACGACGGTLSPQVSASMEPRSDTSSIEFKKFRRFLSCHNEGCPQALMPIDFPR